jgi:hypothetical protein
VHVAVAEPVDERGADADRVTRSARTESWPAGQALRDRCTLEESYPLSAVRASVLWPNREMEISQLETAIAEEHKDSRFEPRDAEADGLHKSRVESDAPTVGAVFDALLRHPARLLIERWNWKAAVLSSVLRAAIFFFTNLVAGWRAAVGALLAELALRAATSGFYGAITEAFSEARPAWAATAAALIVLPLANHSLEFLVHWLRGTPKLGMSITASVIFTALSTSFNLYVMRHGVLTVGGRSKSLREDLALLLPLLGQFLLAGPRALFRGIRNLVRS